MYQHTGLSQPGYGLLGLGVACGGLREAGPPQPQELCGVCREQRPVPLESMRNGHWSERSERTSSFSFVE